MHKQALLICSPGFAANEADTTCLPAQQQLILSINKNFPAVTIIILAFQYPFSSLPYQWNGNQVIPFGGNNKKRLYRLLLWFRIWRKLNVLKNKYELKGIACFWYGECTLIGRLFAKGNDLPCRTWILGQDAKQGNRYAKWLKPLPDELVAISDFVAREFEKNYAVRPGHIIPNAVTPALFPEYYGHRNIDLIGVGSLIALKRYDLFIQVVTELKKENPFLKAVICGKGEEKNKLESLIKDNGLIDNITLTGELPYTEVLQLMQRSKILLHPSSYEGFSGVCLEALYAGAHVISFCNPKNAWIRQWHIAGSINEMTAIAAGLLKDTETVYRSVLAYDMDDSAESFMQLFM